MEGVYTPGRETSGCNSDSFASVQATEQQDKDEENVEKVCIKLDSMDMTCTLHYMKNPHINLQVSHSKYKPKGQKSIEKRMFFAILKTMKDEIRQTKEEIRSLKSVNRMATSENCSKEYNTHPVYDLCNHNHLNLNNLSAHIATQYRCNREVDTVCKNLVSWARSTQVMGQVIVVHHSSVPGDNMEIVYTDMQPSHKVYRELMEWNWLRDPVSLDKTVSQIDELCEIQNPKTSVLDKFISIFPQLKKYRDQWDPEKLTINRAITDETTLMAWDSAWVILTYLPFASIRKMLHWPRELSPYSGFILMYARQLANETGVVWEDMVMRFVDKQNLYNKQAVKFIRQAGCLFEGFDTNPAMVKTLVTIVKKGKSDAFTSASQPGAAVDQ